MDYVWHVAYVASAGRSTWHRLWSHGQNTFVSLICECCMQPDASRVSKPDYDMFCIAKSRTYLAFLVRWWCHVLVRQVEQTTFGARWLTETNPNHHGNWNLEQPLTLSGAPDACRRSFLTFSGLAPRPQVLPFSTRKLEKVNDPGLLGGPCITTKKDKE